MKKLVMSIMVTFMIGNNSDLVFAQQCPEELRHYWKFEEDSKADDFMDIVGGLNAQVETGTLQVLGIVNSGQYFNGLSEISIPDNSTFDWKNDDSFTIEYWINKTSECPQNSYMYNNVVIGRDDASSELHWWTGVNCTENGTIDLTLVSNDGSTHEIIGKKSVIDGNWHHVVITRNGDNNKSRIYVDGSVDAEGEFAFDADFLSDVPVNIGWLNSNGKYHLDASIDELAVYNVALDDETILGHYNEGSGCDYCSGLVTEMPDIDDETGFFVYPTLIQSEFIIKFEISEDQNVQLSLFDITGRKISDYINATLNKGSHEYTFNVGNLQNALAIIQMKINEQIHTRKIIIQ